MAAGSFLFFGLLVYGIGVAASQSLMSLGGALFAGWALVLATRELIRTRRLPLWTGLALVWTVYLVTNLALRPWDARSGHTLGALPLFLVPVLAQFQLPRLGWRAWSWLFRLWGLTYLVATAYALTQFLTLGIPGSSFMRNPIYYAYTLLPAFVFFAETARRRDRRGELSPRLAAGLAALHFVAIVASMNRMVLLIVLGYSVVALLPTIGRRYGWHRAALVVALGLGSVTLAIAVIPQAREKAVRTVRGDDPSIQWRFVAWRHNWNLFMANPAFGVGPEKNGIDSARDAQFEGPWAPGHLIFAHSIYFQALADAGLIGFVLLIAYFGAAFVWGDTRVRVLIAATMIGGLTENTFNNSRPTHATLFYLLLAGLLGIGVNAKAERDRANPARSTRNP